jgi:hypothetical protein
MPINTRQGTMVYLKAVLGFSLALTIAPASARAQEMPTGAALYDQGVEAYFDGRSAEADSCFSRAIAANSSDPRAYYFRSIIRLRQGRGTEGRADMQKGADLESRQPRRYDIGKSLERVQGPSRLVLEQYRDNARMIAATNIAPKPLAAPDAEVLRHRQVVPLDELLKPGTPRAVAVPEPGLTNSAPPSSTAPPPATNPSKPPAKEASPFDEQPPAAEPKAAASKEASPFDEAPAATTEPKMPPAKVQPAAKAPAPIPPQPTPPAEKTPAKAEDNPF